MKVKMLMIAAIFTCIGFFANGQWIQSLTITPANPTSTDTITILAECSFPAAGCDMHTQYVSIVGSDIYASALHCLGVLTVICPYTDTIIINPLPIGNYTFYFQLDAGFGPVPCTPGIVTGPSDSINFIVSPVVGLSEFLYQDAVSVFPNPFNEQFQITGIAAEEYPARLEIYSREGKIVKTISLKNSGDFINVNTFPASVYHLKITNRKGIVIDLPAIKN